METWKATIKERGNDTLLTPSCSFANMDEYINDERQREYEQRKFLVDFWGLNNKYVEWYTLKKVNGVMAFMYYIYNRCGKRILQQIINKQKDMKQVKFLAKLNNKQEIILTGKVGERVFPIVNNVKETNDAIRWCNTHNIGDVFDCDEYRMEIVKEL